MIIKLYIHNFFNHYYITQRDTGHDVCSCIILIIVTLQRYIYDNNDNVHNSQARGGGGDEGETQLW